jgi:copper chaperone CopZ
MEKQYAIKGMACGGCVANVKKLLEGLPEVEQAEVQLTAPQGKVRFSKPVPIAMLQKELKKGGNYTIEEI